MKQKLIVIISHELYQVPDIAAAVLLRLSGPISVAAAIRKTGIRAVYLAFEDARPMLAGDDDLYAAVQDKEWLYTWPWPHMGD